jgi:tRNA-dihydrouridine synthase B
VTWKVDDIVIPGNVVLASMTQITDLPFRLLCRELGANLAFTAMVNCNAVSRGNKAARRIYYTVPEDAPLGIQLFGSRPDRFLRTAQIIGIPHSGAFLEVNFSCPDRVILAQGAGAALLRRPTRMKDIVSCLVDEQSLPVTAKLRLSSTDVNKTIKTAILLENAGASAITLHARTVVQKNSGSPLLTAISEVKQAVTIPVIGNGGVEGSAQAYGKMLAITSCDGVMIGKAAIYNPGLFGRLQGNQDWNHFSPATRISWVRSYVNYAMKHDCLTQKNVLQRAKDFLRPYLPMRKISHLHRQDSDPFAFLSKLEDEIKAHS